MLDKANNNHNSNNKNFHKHNFYRSVSILLLTKEEKKKKLNYFIPTSYFHQKSIKCIKFGSMAEFHHKSDSKETFSKCGYFRIDLIIQPKYGLSYFENQTQP